MGFIRAYARIAIGLALLEIAYSALGLGFQSAAETAGMVVTMLRVLWVVVSFIAILAFPVFGAPIWSPLLYIALDLASLVITLLMVGSVGDHGSWLGAVQNAHTLLYEANLAAAVVYLGVTAPLLKFTPAPPPASLPASAGVPPASAEEAPTAPPAQVSPPSEPGSVGVPPAPTESETDPEAQWTI